MRYVVAAAIVVGALVGSLVAVTIHFEWPERGIDYTRHV